MEMGELSFTCEWQNPPHSDRHTHIHTISPKKAQWTLFKNENVEKNISEGTSHPQRHLW